MDEKLSKLKISSSLEMNLRRYKKKRSKSSSQSVESIHIPVIEPESTFEIGRSVPGPVDRIQPRMVLPSGNNDRPEDPMEREDMDLEERLRSLLNDGLFQ